MLLRLSPVAARKNDAPVGVQAAIINVAGLGLNLGGGELNQTSFRLLQHRVDWDQWRGCR